MSNSKLKHGKRNNIDNTLYSGARAETFDSAALFAYLYEQAMNEYHPEDMLAVCEMFEAEFHPLSNVYVFNAMERFNKKLDVPHVLGGDDMVTFGAIHTFVDEYTRHHGGLSMHVSDESHISKDTPQQKSLSEKLRDITQNFTARVSNSVLSTLWAHHRLWQAIETKMSQDNSPHSERMMARAGKMPEPGGEPQGISGQGRP